MMCTLLFLAQCDCPCLAAVFDSLDRNVGDAPPAQVKPPADQITLASLVTACLWCL
jgi:hypothetical protein